MDQDRPADASETPVEAPVTTETPSAAAEAPVAAAAVGWQLPDQRPRSRRRRWFTIALTVVVVVLAVGLVGNLAKPRSPADQAFEDVGQQLLDDPVFKARYSTLTSREDAFKTGTEIVVPGLRRLDDGQLLTYWSVIGDVVGNLDVQSCADLFAGKTDTAHMDAIATALRKLPIERLRQYGSVAVAAALAELHDSPPPVAAPSADARNAAYAALFDSIQTGRERFVDIAARFSSASADDQCWFGRTMTTSALALPGPTRTVVLRSLISGS